MADEYMEYTTLGNSGLTVSRICLGCMGFSNDPSRWGTDPEESKRIVDRAIDLGINFFDTANMDADGDSESILGNALSEYDTDRSVVATKIHPTLAPAAADHPNGAGLSRKAIDQELKHSLDRLGMDTVDLYQIHRYDPDTPILETLRALSNALQRGKIRYIGASSMRTHEIAEAMHISDRHQLERFISMQNHHNLVYREEEREMNPYCRKTGIGVIPYSPLASGYLTRPDSAATSTERGDQRDWEYERECGGREINARVEELAEKSGVTMAQIALAWHLRKEAISAPIVGVTSVDHLNEAVEALEITLSQSDMDYLEEPYEPKRVKPVFVNPSEGPYRPLDRD